MIFEVNKLIKSDIYELRKLGHYLHMNDFMSKASITYDELTHILKEINSIDFDFYFHENDQTNYNEGYGMGYEMGFTDGFHEGFQEGKKERKDEAVDGAVREGVVDNIVKK